MSRVCHRPRRWDRNLPRGYRFGRWWKPQPDLTPGRRSNRRSSTIHLYSSIFDSGTAGHSRHSSPIFMNRPRGRTPYVVHANLDTEGQPELAARLGQASASVRFSLAWRFATAGLQPRWSDAPAVLWTTTPLQVSDLY